MNTRFGALCAATWALGATCLLAASFWDAKAYTEWSQKEVEEMLADSPWARKISVVIPIPPRESGDVIAGRGGRGGDDGTGRGFPVPAPQVKLVITWRSALPVRQALIRSANGAAGGLVDGPPLLEQPEFYVITLAGVPARFSRLTATANTTSFLRHGRKTPIALVQGGQLAGSGGALTLVFAFPRTDPITLDDRDVEFVTTLGTIEIRKKFILKDLLIDGRLEL
jgi:hypothetical protein